LKLTETELYYAAMTLDRVVKEAATKQRKARSGTEDKIYLANLENLELLVVRSSIHALVNALKSLEKE
jgi:hypothetical protein